MAKYVKWLGGTLGWAFGGPIGGLLGFVLGTIYDNAEGDIKDWGVPQPKARSARERKETTTRGDFEASMLVLAAAVMRADDVVKRSELSFVKQFMLTQFGEQRANELLPVLKGLLQQDIPVQQVAAQIRYAMDHPSRLQLLHFLFNLAKADGFVHPKEVTEVTRIANYLGISHADFVSIKAMFITETKENAYRILEIEPSATDEEVKKAYKRMAVRYHPDKVAHLGEEHQRMAQEKFQRLAEAYEQVRKEREMA